MPNADAGVVDQDIDAAHQLDRFSERGLHLFEIADIGGERAREIGQFVFDALARRLIAVEHAHHRTFFEEARRGGCSNAAGPAGDQDTLFF